MKLSRVILQKTHTALVLARRLVHAWRNEGFHAVAQVVHISLIDFLPWRRWQRPRPSEFDLRFGVDTSGIVRIASMEIDSANYLHAHYYQASRPDVIHEAIGKLGIDFSKYTFIDYGSGKGLALLVASEYPFEEIIGVEFAADLHRIAERNIAAYSNTAQRCRSIRSVCGDAAEFTLPERPLIAYFYDPFGTPVLKKVLAKMAGSYAAQSRPLILIYHGAPPQSAIHQDAPDRARAIASQLYLTRTRHDEICSVYESPEVRQDV